MRMHVLLMTIYLLALSCKSENKTDFDCTCDTVRVKSELLSYRQGSSGTSSNFYDLSKEANQQLWFDEIESIDSTQFTRLWDDYHENNFRTSHADFKDYYEKSAKVELAFQLGPEGPLWTYYTFVLRKEKCCYIFSRTNFAHARFRFKAYSFVSQSKVDSLFGYLELLQGTKITEDNSNYYSAAFVNNRKNEVVDVLLEEYELDKDGQPVPTPPDSSITRFVSFLEKQIRWTETYPLEPVEPVEIVPKVYEEVQISGTYKTGSFKGTMTLERKECYMFYSWSLVSEKGKLLAAKSEILDFKEIPKDQDQFEFAKAQALERIREYKINSKKIFYDLIVN